MESCTGSARSHSLHDLMNWHPVVFSGYSGSLTMRLLAGEHTLGFPATIPWPWYDAEMNLQVFPHRTIAMLTGATLTLLVSYITHRLFTENIVHAKHDRWNAVVNVRKNNNNKRRVDSDNVPEPKGSHYDLVTDYEVDETVPVAPETIKFNTEL